MSQYWYTGRDKGSEIVALDLSHLREVEREEKTPFSDAIVGSYTSANTHQALWSIMEETIVERHLTGIEPLSGSNFKKWKSQLEIVLGCMECMTSPSPRKCLRFLNQTQLNLPRQSISNG
ncbi:uncharacterized protein LOC113319340 [Papaver somniferum]|uniref:uncharacterized protein LOC113319340 n=1 Tax=Papaver somniferum TaxID=3469 RepID=UPI000E6FCD78|nr:uncharacterized protein LOC113319340 [Papaver somniferum]